MLLSTALLLLVASSTPASPPATPRHVRLYLLPVEGTTFEIQSWALVAEVEYQADEQEPGCQPQFLPSAVLPTTEAVLTYVTMLPKGSTVLWAHGCSDPSEGTPLATTREQEDFQRVCENAQVSCTIHRAG